MPDCVVAAASGFATSAVVTVVVNARVLLLRSRCGFRCTSAASNDDDVAALLAANLEDLALDLVVRDRVLGLASITYDLHGYPCIRGSRLTTPK
jgi:hypothetical protein